MASPNEKTSSLPRSEETEILSFISALKNGNFSKKLEIANASPSSQAIIGELNSLAETLNQKQPRQNFDRERFLDAVSASMPELISYVDRDLNYRYVNTAYEKWFGITREQCLKSNMQEILGAQALEKIRTFIDETLKGNPQSFSATLPYLRGGTREVFIQYHPDFDPQKKVQGITIVVKDITEIKKDEVRNAVITETMTDGYVIQDEKGAIHSFNFAALKILGLSEDQLKGRTSYDESWKAFKENGLPYEGDEHPAMIALRSGNSVRAAIMGLTLPSGENRWIRINATPFETLYGAKKEKQVVCTFSDVTDLVSMRTENAFILDALKIGLWKFNPTNQSLHWDQSMYKIFDVSESDFTGHYQAWESTLSPEAKSQAVDELGKALRGEKEFDTVFEINTKSKGKRLISGRAIVKRDTSGAPTMMFGINIDVTTEKEREKEIADQHQQLTLLTNNMSSAVSRIDREGRYTFANKHYEEWFGLSQTQIIGKKHSEVLPPEVYARAESNIKKALSGERISFEVPFQTVKGASLWAYTNLIPVFDENSNPDGFLTISHDITSIKEATSKLVQASKLASLGEMCAGIAHEINNPLAIIAGSVPLLIKFKEDQAKFDSKTDGILKAASRIEKIVKGLKKFSRTTEGNSYKVESLTQIVSESVFLTEAKSKRDSVKLTTEIEDGLFIFCDEVEIEQVLVNLINNGTDATKNQTEKWIKLNAFKEDQQVVLRVIDSGLGISQEIEQKLFQPFFTTKSVGEGTGLGLSIAKGIIEAHQGTLTVNHSLKNTCFEIRLPSPKVDPNEVKNVA